ncbi:restriction endonuclease S subunit [Flavobacterium sp. 9]|uniref:restriction endonuclease subunit S n=1 Tax=Flavobacterium sp. 9 TaxID=2035198 RepID=UPI000C17DF8D|nr:restriction endonuclease subunit S [Flavobacterium sp. 9]PIF34539.1 restriction endonuclease S subunit [Flavobacterium sp. 9]
MNKIINRKDWFFGKIPADWDIVPLKYVCDKFSVYGANVSADNYSVHGIRFLRTTDINDDGTLTNNGVYIDEKIVGDYKLNEGDLLLSRSGTLGRSYIHSYKNGTCAYAGYLVRYILNKKVNPKFAFYLTKTVFFENWLSSSLIEATIGNVNGEKYANMLIPLPSLEKQKHIVNYLDREILLIDDLINAKEKLISLMLEKREALITKAVIKGVNSKIKFKSSGIEWLKEIPEDWEIKKIKYISNLKSGEFISAESIKESGNYPVYGGNGLRGYTNKNTHGGEFVLIGRQGALCGNINYAEGEFWATEHAIVCHPIVNYDLFWLGELLRIMNLNQYSVAAAQPGLSVDVIKNLSIPFPSFDNQKQISEYIRVNLSKIDKLKSATSRSIKLLKERKVSLISGAVTCGIKISKNDY